MSNGFFSNWGFKPVNPMLDIARELQNRLDNAPDAVEARRLAQIIEESHREMANHQAQQRLVGAGDAYNADGIVADINDIGNVALNPERPPVIQNIPQAEQIRPIVQIQEPVIQEPVIQDPIDLIQEPVIQEPAVQIQDPVIDIQDDIGVQPPVIQDKGPSQPDADEVKRDPRTTASSVKAVASSLLGTWIPLLIPLVILTIYNRKDHLVKIDLKIDVIPNTRKIYEIALGKGSAERSICFEMVPGEKPRFMFDRDADVTEKKQPPLFQPTSIVSEGTGTLMKLIKSVIPFNFSTTSVNETTQVTQCTVELIDPALKSVPTVWPVRISPYETIIIEHKNPLITSQDAVRVIQTSESKWASIGRMRIQVPDVTTADDEVTLQYNLPSFAEGKIGKPSDAYVAVTQKNM